MIAKIEIPVTSIETSKHVIEISEGCLAIDEKKFPDDCVSLTEEETDAVLHLLLSRRPGLEENAGSEVQVLREVNLGQHTLFIWEDLSIDITDLSGEPWSYLADNALRLSRDETFRLCISLQDIFKC